MLHVLKVNKKLKCSQIKNSDVNNVKAAGLSSIDYVAKDTTLKMADYLHSILKSTCEQTLIFTKLQFIIQFHSLAQWTIMQ